MAHGNRDSLFTTHSPTNRGDSPHDYSFRRDEDHTDSSSKFSYHSDRDFSPFQQRYSGKEPPEDTEKQFEYIDMVEQTDTTSTASRQQSPRRKAGLKRKLHRLRRSNVPLVTTASYSPTQNRKKREKQYMWIQGSRLPFLLLAMVTYMSMHNVWLSALLFIISVPLPWIAVVLANGIGEPRDARAPAVYKPAALREQAAAQDRQRAQMSQGTRVPPRQLPAGSDPA